MASRWGLHSLGLPVSKTARQIRSVLYWLLSVEYLGIICIATWPNTLSACSLLPYPHPTPSPRASALGMLGRNSFPPKALRLHLLLSSDTRS